MIFRVKPEIFNGRKARTGECLRGSLVVIVKSKDATPFLSFDFTNTIKLVFSIFNEFTLCSYILSLWYKLPWDTGVKGKNESVVHLMPESMVCRLDPLPLALFSNSYGIRNLLE